MAAKSDLHFKLCVADAADIKVVRFELDEGLSRPFRLNLELSSFDDSIDPNAWLDREATFTIERDGAAERVVVGVVTAFEQCETGFHRTRYRAVVESPLARLALRHNSRIFQRINATEVLATLMKEHRVTSIRTAYSGIHESREYCVQYRETDATFLHRLATDEGIVHWHEVSEGCAMLVLADRIDSAPSLDAPVLY